MLDEALAQARRWLDDGQVPVAVNLSPRCLLDATLLASSNGLLVEHGVPAGMLRLEVTETAVMADPRSRGVLTGCTSSASGCRSTTTAPGTRSMALPPPASVDELKVDRSFVSNMTDNDNDAVLVRSAIDLGHNLGLTVVAEGVEEAEHVAALREFGCDIAQGYHYARPMPPAGVTELLNRRAGFSRPGGDVPTGRRVAPAWAARAVTRARRCAAAPSGPQAWSGRGPGSSSARA